MSRSKQPETAKMHILFADDEVNLQELMRSELTRMGYAVTVCPDGLTAVAALEKEPFDCLMARRLHERTIGLPAHIRSRARRRSSFSSGTAFSSNFLHYFTSPLASFRNDLL